MDGDQPLTAESNGNTTFYLYGLGAIGEKTTDWAYSLPDGVNTPRQLADLTGDITLSTRYTPWGDTLETYGIGNFTFGYFGGMMDSATGLLYVGDGQYYDPATGRFLTRDARPNNSNPYVPWDPTGALLGPLGLLALVYGRKKKGSKAGMLLALLLVGVSVGMTLAACGGGQLPEDNFTATAIATSGSPITYTVTSDSGTFTGTLPASTGAGVDVLETPCAEPPDTPTPTGTPTPMPTPSPLPINLPLPNINDIPDMESTPLSVQEKTINAYREMREALYNQDPQYVEASTGKIRDDVLMAAIISSEFNVFKELYPDTYREALEALSNQYDSGRKIYFSNPGNMLCYGSCTIETQIAWLYDIQGIRATTFIQSKIQSGVWTTYLSDARSATNGYVNGHNSSWFWGNVTADELCKYNVVQKVYWPGLYPDKPYFIVHAGRGQC